MSDLNAELVDHYWARIDLLALEAEAGDDVAFELAGVIEDAIDAFADAANPAFQLESLIGDLQITADAYREERPAYAAVFSRAALLATNSSIEPA